MASRSVSPGGALLRASRIFSIPSPLPRPSGDLSSTAIFNSNTATVPHPTHLSITTPQSSLARGDWGFKRPLPLRSTTRTSTPLIRVEAIDTFEHITEFGSAADHTLTLQKWQEMGVPLSTPSPPKPDRNFPGDLVDSGKSVFEDAIDATAPVKGGMIAKEDTRWKFSGPWLAGLNEGGFNTYVQKEVRRRKNDFHKFLRTACADTTTRERQRAASESGEEIGPAVQVSDVTDQQVTEYIKSLRQDRRELYRLIRSFLDLPPSPNARITDDPDSFSKMITGLFTEGKTPSIKSDDYAGPSDSPYADSGPPKTHPSAGLSYGRTSSHIFNHPVYGPQRNKPPVQARVVMPKGAATGNFAPVLGVGGFVVDVPVGVEGSFDLRGRNSKSRGPQKPLLPGLLNIEPEKVGGSKAWVHPKHARIDPKGRVILSVVPADPDAVAVREGTVGDIPDEYQRPSPARNFGFPRSITSLKEGYGLGFGKTGSNWSGPASGTDADSATVSELANLMEDYKKP